MTTAFPWGFLMSCRAWKKAAIKLRVLVKHCGCIKDTDDVTLFQRSFWKCLLSHSQSVAPSGLINKVVMQTQHGVIMFLQRAPWLSHSVNSMNIKWATWEILMIIFLWSSLIPPASCLNCMSVLQACLPWLPSHLLFQACLHSPCHLCLSECRRHSSRRPRLPSPSPSPTELLPQAWCSPSQASPTQVTTQGISKCSELLLTHNIYITESQTPFLMCYESGTLSCRSLFWNEVRTFKKGNRLSCEPVLPAWIQC